MAIPSWLKYANMGAVRDDPLSPELIAMLEAFMPELGLGLEVFSGGQAAEGPDRTGSHRHDYGNAADVFFTKDGRRLDWANPEDLPLIQQAIRRGRAAGITGWGAGAGYMQPGSVHLGLGTPSVWGAGGQGENAPDWLKQAYYDGTADAKMKAAGYTPEQRRNAIASIESAGSGDYAATGAWTGDPEEGRDRAYGRYQVMGANIGPWAEQYLQKKGITAEQFLADPKLQDELFDAVYGDYVKQYGERGAASKWFTGSEKEPLRSDVHGKLTGRSYADEYMKALGGGVSGPVEAAGGGAGNEAGQYTSGGAGDSSNPYLDALKNRPEDKKKSPWEVFGSGVGDAASAMLKAGQGFDYNIPNQPGPARVDVPTAPIVDPQQAEMRRQMLAQAMARLNSGSLV